VPEGKSFWEIGTGIGIRDKATSDCDKLTSNTHENDRREASFVFVTPMSARKEHSWSEQAQREWVEERRRRQEWKDVQVLDGTRLVDWIHGFPAVEQWLADRIGGPRFQDIETPEQRWNVIRSIGEPPPLTHHVFLANRGQACEKVKAVLDATTMRLKLATHYSDHVPYFVAAYISSLSDEDRADAIGRCLFVSSEDAWVTLCKQYRNLILVADSRLDLNGEMGTTLIQRAQKASHAVIFAGTQGGIPDPSSMPLSIPRTAQVQEALERAGHREERARMLAQKSSGNLGSLLRCLQNLSIMPEWAEGSAASDLAIAMMVGSWKDESESDRLAVEQLVGKEYGEWIGKVREVVHQPGTPLVCQGGVWRFAARYEGWYALGSRLFDEHLDMLQRVAVTVLKEVDPQFDLPPEQRHTASVYGKTLSHSSTLRRGLAETLALLGSHPKPVKSCTHGKSESTAILSVREILKANSWQVWASLDDLLPLLAEAAPNEFLAAVEAGLQSDPCPFDELFAQERSGVFGRTHMSGLLWALETLAWDQNLLNRVIVDLADLAARDQGGQWVNRPENSLTAIFLPWLPQTCAPIPKRVSALRTLLSEANDTGWKLLVRLLPTNGSTSTGSRRPEWRSTIPEEWSRGVSPQEYEEQLSAIANLAVDEARESPTRLGQLIDSIAAMPKVGQAQLLMLLNSNPTLALPDSERVCMWNKLIKIVNWHRRHPGAKRAMAPQLVEQIASVAERLEPKNPYFQHQRLFVQGDYELFEDDSDYDKGMKEIEERREKAVEEVVAHGGPSAVLQFAKAVETPWRVGIAFGKVAGNDDDHAILPTMLESEERALAQLAGGFIWGRHERFGWEWVDQQDVSEWSPAQIGAFLSYLPFTRDTWDRVSFLLSDKQGEYWTKTSANPFATKDGLHIAVDRLVEARRPHAAVTCLYRMVHAKLPVDPQQIVRTLIAGIGSGQATQSMGVHETVEVIKALQEHPESKADDVFRVEWAYLSLLDKHSGTAPRLIWHRLCSDPAFFCTVVRTVFRPRGNDSAREEVSEEQRTIAAHGYKLLREWRTPPGFREDGEYDGEALDKWLSEVTEICKKSGHLEIAMETVGHTLVGAPKDPDGLWIHGSAASVLNARDAEHLRKGFEIQLYNSRGTHAVDPSGNAEREIARGYRTKAEEVEQAGFHRLATTLRDLATTYDREAERVSSESLFD
jgi:hypothetical protein